MGPTILQIKRILCISFSVDSFLYSSKFIKQQIEDLQMLVKVVFVGDNFQSTVEYLETKSAAIASGEKSYLLFHYTPSLVAHTYNLTSIKFDPCNQPFPFRSNGSESPNCLYAYNRFAKVNCKK